MMQLVVHIGAPKCASTTIQNHLKDNARALRQAGILIPDRSTSEVVHRFVRRECGGADLIDAIKRLGREASGCNKIILSAEGLFQGVGPRERLIEPFNHLSKDFDITVILYVRRQDEWLESAWKQWYVKTDKRPFRQWLLEHAERGLPDFYSAASAWRAAGHSLYVNAVHPPLLHGGDVIVDFCRAAGIPCHDGKRRRANPIIDARLLGFLHRHNDILFTGAHDNRLYHLLEITGIGAARHGLDGRLLQDEERRAILSMFAQQNRGLIRELSPDRHDTAAAYFGIGLPAVPWPDSMATDEGEPGRIERAAARTLATIVRFLWRMNRLSHG